MSKTLTRQGYTDVYIVEDSSVIDTAYYDEDTHRLYVALRNGTRVGYEGFTPFSWLTFKKYESAGSFWNRYIKGAYRGLDGDVELFDRNEVQTEVVNSAVVTQAHTAFSAFRDVRTQEVPLTHKYHVLVEVSATDFASAVENVGSGAVKSVTQL